MSGSPFGLWINPKLLTSGSPFALWINLLLTSGPEDLMLSALLLYYFPFLVLIVLAEGILTS